MLNFITEQINNPLNLALALMLWKIGWVLGGSFVYWLNTFIGSLVGEEPTFEE